jgi:hypothetical protein
MTHLYLLLFLTRVNAENNLHLGSHHRPAWIWRPTNQISLLVEACSRASELLSCHALHIQPSNDACQYARLLSLCVQLEELEGEASCVGCRPPSKLEKASCIHRIYLNEGGIGERGLGRSLWLWHGRQS